MSPNTRHDCSIVGLYRKPGFEAMVLVKWDEPLENEDVVEWITETDISKDFSSIEGHSLDNERIVIWWGRDNCSNIMVSSIFYAGNIQEQRSIKLLTRVTLNLTGES